MPRRRGAAPGTARGLPRFAGTPRSLGRLLLALAAVAIGFLVVPVLRPGAADPPSSSPQDIAGDVDRVDADGHDPSDGPDLTADVDDLPQDIAGDVDAQDVDVTDGPEQDGPCRTARCGVDDGEVVVLSAGVQNGSARDYYGTDVVPVGGIQTGLGGTAPSSQRSSLPTGLAGAALAALILGSGRRTRRSSV